MRANISHMHRDWHQICAEINIKSRKKVENQLSQFEKLIGQEWKASHRDHPRGLWSLKIWTQEWEI